MNIFLFIVSTVFFFSSFPMFAYSFVVPEQFAAWLFGAGVVTACIAFVIPIVFLGQSRR
jgi:hypothetical protein